MSHLGQSGGPLIFFFSTNKKPNYYYCSTTYKYIPFIYKRQKQPAHLHTPQPNEMTDVGHSHSKFEKGVEIIKSIFHECEELSKCKIDERLVMHPENYKTYNGLSHLLTQMGLSMSRDHTVCGKLPMYMDKPQETCEKFSVSLRSNKVIIFTWIENFGICLRKQ